MVIVALLPDDTWGAWLDDRAVVRRLAYAGQPCSFASADQARDYINSYVGPKMYLSLPTGFDWGDPA